MQWVRNGSRLGYECSGYGKGHAWVMNVVGMEWVTPRLRMQWVWNGSSLGYREWVATCRKEVFKSLDQRVKSMSFSIGTYCNKYGLQDSAQSPFIKILFMCTYTILNLSNLF